MLVGQKGITGFSPFEEVCYLSKYFLQFIIRYSFLDILRWISKYICCSDW